jgi:hypothetical protein
LIVGLLCLVQSQGGFQIYAYNTFRINPIISLLVWGKVKGQRGKGKFKPFPFPLYPKTRKVLTFGKAEKVASLQSHRSPNFSKKFGDLVFYE